MRPGDTTRKMKDDSVLPLPEQEARPDTVRLSPDKTQGSATATPRTESQRTRSRLGGYRLLRELGRGGMGVVYAARKKDSTREVALKVLTGEVDPEAVERFRREALATAKLTHPGIVAIDDFGKDHGRFFMVMKLVEGESLKDILRRGPLEPGVAADITRQLAEALAHAHARGVVHRDLKPQNVLVATDGAVRITDFGLAKMLSDTRKLTVTGQMLGTPAYMAPEQTGIGGGIDARTDVYALGATLYEMLTCEPPFTGRTALEVLTDVAEKAPRPPSTLRPALAPTLERICLQCLEKDPAKRFPSATHLAKALTGFQEGDLDEPAPRNKALLAALAGLLLVVWGTGLALFLQRDDEPPGETADEAPAVSERQVAEPSPKKTTPNTKTWEKRKHDRLRREDMEQARSMMAKLDHVLALGKVGTPETVAMEQVIKLVPFLGDAHLRLALVRDRRGNRELALKVLNEAERRGCHPFLLNALRGRWLYELGRFEPSLEPLKAALHHARAGHPTLIVKPLSEEPNLLAMYLDASVRTRQPGRALDVVKQLAKPSVSGWRSREALARCAFALGDWQEALLACDRAHDLGKGEIHVPLTTKATILRQRRAYPQAEAALEKAAKVVGLHGLANHPEVATERGRLRLAQKDAPRAILELTAALRGWWDQPGYRPDVMGELFPREGPVLRRWRLRRSELRRARQLEILELLCKTLRAEGRAIDAKVLITQARARPDLRLDEDAAALKRLQGN